jgi:hypothetical protein
MNNLTKWLYQKINTVDTTRNIDLVNDLYNELMVWYQSNDDLILTIDEDSFKILFYNFIYNKYG